MPPPCFVIEAPPCPPMKKAYRGGRPPMKRAYRGGQRGGMGGGPPSKKSETETLNNELTN